MTGKRPRALTRTASVSQLGSGTFSEEFSPLPENPKEKLKPSPKESKSVAAAAAGSAPRVVIGFDPKPAAATSASLECGTGSPMSGSCGSPCSPGCNEKVSSSSPRSVLNSLFSRQQRCAKPSDGVGLGIALATPSVVEEVAEVREVPVPDHITIRVRDIPIVYHQRRHSHPIPTPGISSGRSISKDSPVSAASKRTSPRPVHGWLESDPVNLDRRDTFLLGVTPAGRPSVFNNGVVAAAVMSASHFLDECSFCKRHLPKDKDIFMYRGDKAFCSVECRQQQIILDDRSKNCSSSVMQGSPSTTSSRRAPAASVLAAA